MTSYPKPINAPEVLLSDRGNLSQILLVSVNPKPVKLCASFLILFNPSQPSLVMAIFHSTRATHHILLKSTFSTSISRSHNRTRFHCFSIRSALGQTRQPKAPLSCRRELRYLLCGASLSTGAPPSARSSRRSPPWGAELCRRSRPSSRKTCTVRSLVCADEPDCAGHRRLFGLSICAFVGTQAAIVPSDRKRCVCLQRFLIRE
jgi:hypothetical protein